MGIAVITGASSGIGREFARLTAEKEKVDAVWLIARRKERLEEVAEELSVPSRVFAMDMTCREDMDAFRAALEEEKPDVSLFVNAAGFGKIGFWDEVSREDAMAVVQLNCVAAVDMTDSVLPYIGAGGRVIEVCSTAAFQPFQGLNTYAASKAFLFSYTRALTFELLRRKITVTAVCPYWITDTEFIDVAKQTGSRAIRHFAPGGKARSTAARALRASRMGFPVATTGIVSTVHRVVAKFIPGDIMMFIWAGLRRI